MGNISITRPLNRSVFGLVLLLSVIVLAAVACGSDSGGGSAGTESGANNAFAKIDSPDSVFSIEQLVNAGFKKNKTYNVEGLEGATEAHYGFYGPDPYSRKEYEVRFYPSHQVALESGVSFADEATGEDAVVLEDVQRWDEGLTQRRQCAGNGGHHSGKCDNAKYGDYVIRGNMILMCQGKDSKDAVANCKALLEAMQVSS